MLKRIVGSFIVVTLAMLLLTACRFDDADVGKLDDGTVTLELFSNKQESVDTYKGLIAEFEEQNPGIKIKLNVPPEAETVLKTRLAKNDMPDILSIGGNATYGEIARAGVLHDFTDDALLDQVQPAYVDMLNRLVGSETEGIFGIPYATNANGVLYNKEKLNELGLDVPLTWDDFIAALDKAREAGEVPLVFTLKDAWTGMPMWNALAGNLVPTDFPDKKTNGEATFAEYYPEVLDKALVLLEYGEGDIFGIGYEDGNSMFANGTGVFYIQGNWAMPEIYKVNSNIEIGMFALPVTNDASQNKLISGVDVLLTYSEDTKYPEEARKFIEFMISEEIAQIYSDEQNAFSAVLNVLQENPAFENLKVNFEKGLITSFPDHYYPTGLGMENLVQEFLINKDKDAFLEKLDAEWDKVVNR